MAFYEVLATVSLTLALAIPTFLEKVMRAGYERRVENYKEDVLEEFRSVFLEAFEEFSEARELTEEIEEKITDVSLLWDGVKSNYHKLENLLKERTYLFLLWMGVFSLCLITIYSQSNEIFSQNVKFDEFTNIIFAILMLGTIYYFYRLLEFDTKLSKYGRKSFEKKIDLKVESKSPAEKIDHYKEFIKEKEEFIENYLINNNIEFEKEIAIKNHRVDYVIPNAQSPKIILELKFRRSKAGLPHFIYGSVISTFALIKSDFPKVKTVLITNFNLSKYESRYNDLKKFTDAVFQIEQIEKLEEFITKHIKD